MKTQNHRGVALILVLMVLLIFSAVALSMLVEARGSTRLNAGLRLNKLDNTAAFNLLQLLKADVINEYNQVDPFITLVDHPEDARFGELLKNPIDSTDEFQVRYGVDYLTYRGGATLPAGHPFATGQIEMNAGRLILNVGVFIKNNPDDPANALQGTEFVIGDATYTVNSNWDYDGKVVATAVIWNQNGEVMAIQTMQVGPSGNLDPIFRHGNAVQEQFGETTGSGFAEGSGTRITI